MSGISFSGLASGIDFDSLRAALMAVESQKLTRISKLQDTYKARKDAVSDVNNRLTNLIAKIDPILGVGSANLFSKASATSSNTSVLTATSAATATPATYDIKVKNLAIAESVISATGASVGSFTASIAGTDLNPAVPPMTAATLLSSLHGGTGVSDLTSGLVLRHGKDSATIDLSAATTVGDVLNAINASGLGVTAAINGAGNGIDITSGTTNRAVAVEENGGTTASELGIFGSSHVLEVKTAADASPFKVYLDGARDGNAADLSLADIRDSINAVSGKTFTSSLVDSRLVITSNTVGTANALQLTDNAAAGGVLEQLGILIADAGDSSTISNLFSGNNALGGYLQAAADAVFSVNGVEVTRSKNTGITDVIGDVTLNLVGPSTSGASWPADYASTTLTIKKDTASIATALDEFVNQYNSVMDFIGTQTNIDPDGEDGVLAGDSVIRNLGDSLFAAITGINPDLGQDYRSLFELRDSAGNYAFQVSSSGGGKITFNRSAFENLLNEDPDAVAEVFRYDTDADSVWDGGIVQSLKELASSYNASSGILASQVTILGEQIDDLDDDFLALQERLQRQDDALKRQFATAEQLIAGFQSQSSYISSQLAALTR